MDGGAVPVPRYDQGFETRGAGLFAVLMGCHRAVAVVALGVGGAAVHRVHAVRGDARRTVKRRQHDVGVACGNKHSQVSVTGDNIGG